MSSAAAPRSDAWKWWICGLLLLATTINYMDRQTLANVGPRITREHDLSEEQFGELELAFGWAFAAGALIFGILADQTSVRWVYPAVLFAWSLMGFLTGWVEGFWGLLICRLLLGFFEAGHWPCALKTTQRLLPPERRTMGNSILQSGASFGAIATPLIMAALLTPEPGSWRFPFQLIGLAGMGWLFFWFASVRASDFSSPPEAAAAKKTVRPASVPTTMELSHTASEALPDDANPPPPAAASEPSPLELNDDAPREQASSPGPAVDSFWRAIFSRRFLAMFLLVICINVTWQLFRVWLPKFLQTGRGYPEADSLYFVSAYNVATDVGCFGAGFATLWLGRLGLSVHRSRCTVFFFCATLTALSTAAAFLPRGWPLFWVLMLIGCGALGLFPCYYSFSQELTTKHQGKMSGFLGMSAWLVSSPVHKFFGRLVDNTGSYDLGIAVIGWAPLVGFLCLLLLWGREKKSASP